ncbi:Inorganic phosphate transporter pho84 [Tulasnella sp. 331]|nr:Inorganic phosphate transporter pho84 [Tulasnella sp. 331]
MEAVLLSIRWQFSIHTHNDPERSKPGGQIAPGPLYTTPILHSFTPSYILTITVGLMEPAYTLPAETKAERRRAALAEIDTAPFGWYHVKSTVNLVISLPQALASAPRLVKPSRSYKLAILIGRDLFMMALVVWVAARARAIHTSHQDVAGVGFFTDAYDLFAIRQAIPHTRRVDIIIHLGLLSSICAQMIEIVYSSRRFSTSGSMSPSPGFNDNGWANVINGTFAPDAQFAKDQDFGLKVASPIGTLVGQLFFGWAADILGRKKMYGFELMLMLIATFGQALAGAGPSASIYGVLITYRFMMGIGIGGDYPLSAIITSEFAATKFRGRMMNAVFSMQAFGQLAAALVTLIILTASKSQITGSDNQRSIEAVDRVWRLIIGLGTIPAVVAMYFRLTIPETPRFTMDVERNLEQAEEDVDFVKSGKFEMIDDRPIHRVDVPKASKRDFIRHYSKWKNLKILIGTSYSWFAQDIAFYGLALNSTTILNSIDIFEKPESGADNALLFANLRSNAVGNVVLAIAGLIPGYLVSFGLIDVWGRKPIQIMGFSILTVIFLCMGLGFNKMVQSHAGLAAFFFLYCLSNFFQNFGPNSTTFIIPGEVFPTRYRCTSHGISAAWGKLGAIIAQVIFSQLSNNDNLSKDSGLRAILLVFALFMFTGVFSTLLLPETMGKSLEQLNDEEDMEDVIGHHDRTHEPDDDVELTPMFGHMEGPRLRKTGYA